MKKILVMALTAALFAAVLSGCRPTLRSYIEEQNRRAERHELDLDACFSEEEGFHYPGVTWGMDASEFQVATDYAMADVAAYGQAGETFMDCSGLHILLQGRENDEAQMALNPDNICYMISLMFSSEDLKDTELKQQELFDREVAALKARFGEPTDHLESSMKGDTVTTHEDSYIWSYTTADGKETELQLGRAYTLDASNPIYVTIGFVWIDGAPDYGNEAE